MNVLRRVAMSCAIVGTVVAVGCSKSTTSGYKECLAAGGQCVSGALTNMCAKLGPDDTCNCDPDCNPGGSFCCIELSSDSGTGPD
jgi:hypothetical protein